MIKTRMLPLCLVVVCIFGLLTGCTINIGNPSEDAANKTDGKTLFDYIFNNGSTMYESCATIYIVNRTEPAISSSDLKVAKSLVETCSVILQSNKIQDQIREEYPGVEYTVTLESIAETEICEIIATGENPEHLEEICNMAVSLFCEELPQIIEGASCKVVNDAKSAQKIGGK